jgi:hypothetical protein
MEIVRLDLLQNARSFVAEALRKAVVAEDYPEEWKFAILHLAQAVELSLKELLRMQHPVLIYRDVDKPTQTVSLREAALRLQHLKVLELSHDESKALQFAGRLRDSIVHLEFEAAPEALKAAFAKLFGLLVDFHREHLESPLESYVDDAVWHGGIAVREYGEELFRRAQVRMKADDIDEWSAVSCPRCGWRALTPYGDNADKCYVCAARVELVVCDRCQTIMEWGEHEEMWEKTYCTSCAEYLTDDYWYESSVEK